MADVSRWVVAAVLGISLLSTSSAEAGQNAQSSGTATVVSEASLERIRLALAEEHPLVINAALTPTFYAQADAKIPTFSTYLKGWVPARGSGGGGFDVLQLIRDGLRNLQQAQREREARQIRARIDRELLALYGERPGP